MGKNEAYSDSRYVALRKKLIEERNGECQRCRGTNVRLTIHHGYYTHSTEPWEYDSSTLWVLCWSCHTKTQHELAVIHRCIALTPPSDMAKLFPVVADAVDEIFLEEMHEAIEEQQREENEFYGNFEVKLVACDEIGSSRSPDVSDKAQRIFPGISIQIVEVENDVDCTASVTGPARAVVDIIQDWFNKQV